MLNNIIYIAGVARSGTSWVGQIFNSSPKVSFRFQPLFSYQFKDWINENSDKDDFDKLFSAMYKNEDEFLMQADKIKSGEYPLFQKDPNPDLLVFKENRYQNVIEPMLRKLPNVKLMGVVRNPCAVLSSWMKNEKEFPTGAVPLKEWRYGDCKNQGHQDFFGYYKWKEITNLYLDLKAKLPNRVYVQKYEDLVDNPIENTIKIFRFMGLAFESQTEEFLKRSTSSHNASYYAVYKNKDVKDKWRNELDPYIISEVIADLKDTRLEQFLK